ncbi:MAG: MATE family efflux transporter [Paludibacteraceae bacterium]|nr:MATE family efflux transporter [Paludibacteraceae bacterium]
MEKSVQPHIPTELGTEPIGKLLRQYAVPGIIAMTASSLYNMADSIFIGHIGSPTEGAMALSGMAVTFPLMNIAGAFGSMVGVGAAALISIKLGQRDYKTAQSILGNTISLNVIIGLLVSLMGLLFIDPILYFFGAGPQSIGYARSYMEVILYGNVITHLYFGLNSVLRAMGHPRRSMAATINTVVLNIILDPIFIFVFDLGIRGAAIATILSQVSSLVWQVYILSRPNETLRLQRGIYRLYKHIVRGILSIGLSPFLMNLAACVIVILINKGLKTASGDELAIGAYGIVNRISTICFMIVMGINQGMQPIAGYNYGARQNERVRQVLWTSIRFATLVMSVGFLAGELIPDILVSIFTDNEQLRQVAVGGMRIMFASFPIIGFQMVTGNFFQSIGKAKISIFLSLSRQVLFLIPLLLTLPKLWGVNGVWMSMPVADIISAVVAAMMLRWQITRFRKEESPALATHGQR